MPGRRSVVWSRVELGRCLLNFRVVIEIFLIRYLVTFRYGYSIAVGEEEIGELCI